MRKRHGGDAPTRRAATLRARATASTLLAEDVELIAVDERGARCAALWVAVLGLAVADAELGGFHGTSESRALEVQRAWSWLLRGPAGWPLPLRLAVAGIVPDQHHWSTAILPVLQRRWAERDAAAALDAQPVPGTAA